MIPRQIPRGTSRSWSAGIRRALGDRTLIRTGPGGYVLADGGRCWVDAEAFLAAVQAGQAALAARPAEALASFRAALGIWRGEPLPEDTYADWAQADRRHLSLAYLEALDGAAAAALDSAGTAAARGGGLLGQAGAGCRAAARVLGAAAGPRASPLPVTRPGRWPPSTSTGTVWPPRPDWSPRRRPARSASAYWQASRKPASRTPPMRRPARPHGSSPGRKDPFLGREEECAVIADAAAGHGPRVVLVTGPSGIGKSALLAEAARRADVPVLSAQAFAPDQDEAWSLAGRLLRQAARRLPVPVAAVLAEPEASALAEVVPGLAGASRCRPRAAWMSRPAARSPCRARSASSRPRHGRAA